MELLPIHEHLNENKPFLEHPACRDSLQMTVEFYTRVGFEPPWIGYYVQSGDQLVGAAAFKGKPVNGKVEIAYGTFPPFRQQGIGTEICRQLTQLALKTDPSVRVTARILPEESYSTKILRKNGFVWQGLVWDDEDGEVWEWEYLPAP